jgi:hypothetical protein
MIQNTDIHDGIGLSSRVREKVTECSPVIAHASCLLRSVGLKSASIRGAGGPRIVEHPEQHFSLIVVRVGP